MDSEKTDVFSDKKNRIENRTEIELILMTIDFDEIINTSKLFSHLSSLHTLIGKISYYFNQVG